MLILPLILLAATSCRQEMALEAATPITIDIGAAGDEAYVGEGFYGREGPNPQSKIALAAKGSFRWAGNTFALKLPVFPNSHNEIALHAYFAGGMELTAGPNWKQIFIGSGGLQTEYAVVIPREVVGGQAQLVVQGRATSPRQPGEKDKRILFALIDRVIVRPVAQIPKEREREDLMATCADIPTLNRLRGIERRPCDDDPPLFVERLLQERADVVTMGAMFGTGQVFFPSKFAVPHPRMNPQWIPDVTKALREKGFKILCWVVFNVQDLRRVEDFVPAQQHPEWQMRFIETPGKTFGPRVGMCVVSSPCIEWYAQVLRECAALDFDGFFFDGFYLGGIPHPSQPGCTCTFCAEAFRKDTGLALPAKVDWADRTFKRWVRWRNERLLRTARYFQSEMRKVNPRITCTFNYNLWPFARKDWETAIPAWRIDDFGVSQHGYSVKFEEKWLLTGFKARIGRDVNPAHTDMWRPSSTDTTCGKGKVDLTWHEHEIKTFLFAGLTYGITPWHAPGGPVEVTARIHDEVAKRERYFSRDHVCNVGVLYSQNTHDFYGHIPGTENLNTYRDSILGTWMLLTENHVPFEFVFDNQMEDGRFRKYQVLVLPNTAAMSEKAVNAIAAWVRQGGRLIVTADSAAYDEWGGKLKTSRLHSVLGIEETVKSESVLPFGKGKITYLATDPGLAFCRNRDRRLAARLVDAITETSMPFQVEAPSSLVVNLFRSPDKRESWVQLLNVSAFMPNGDSGFRGLDRPTESPKDVASDAQLAGEGPKAGQPVGHANVPAKNVKFSLHGLKPRSARLVIANQALAPDETGQVTIPVIEHHDILVIQP